MHRPKISVQPPLAPHRCWQSEQSESPQLLWVFLAQPSPPCFRPASMKARRLRRTIPSSGSSTAKKPKGPGRGRMSRGGAWRRMLSHGLLQRPVSPVCAPPDRSWSARPGSPRSGCSGSPSAWPTARRVSSTPRSATVATTSPVAGSVTSKVAPESASIHSPPTYAWVLRRVGSWSSTAGSSRVVAERAAA